MDGQIKMFQKLNKEGALCFAMSFIWGYRVKRSWWHKWKLEKVTMEELILKTDADNALTKQIRNRTLTFHKGSLLNRCTGCYKQWSNLCSYIYLPAYLPLVSYEFHAAIKGILGMIIKCNLLTWNLSALELLAPTVF